MQYRNFGNTGLTVSEIGFGAWAIGGAAMVGSTPIGWGHTDDTASAEAIHAAMDAGINFFDTADIYGLGHSETLLGKTVGARSEIIIATKAGNVSRNEQFTFDYSQAYLISACEASLRRLKREVIDYYQLHTARISHLQQGECLEAMETLQQQGKIKHWGLSLNTFEPMPEAGWLLEKDLGEGFQLALNLLNQRALPLLSKSYTRGYGIIARMPLQFGLLTGKMDTPGNHHFANDDHRSSRLTATIIRESATALKPVWQLCTKYQCTRAQLALSYTLSYPEVSVVIPGIRTREQVIDNTAGLIRLEEEDKHFIEHLGQTTFAPLMELIQKQG